MRLVIALGGNALLRRGEPMTAGAQLANVKVAALALADLAHDHQIVVAHGNGPQVGLLSLQAMAYDADILWPLDILGAETEGMIGYLIEQELMNALPRGAQCATLLSRVEVDRADPAFATPSKPIGPLYSATNGNKAKEEHGWEMVSESENGMRRVVPSPMPLRILGLDAVKLLLDAGHCVICAGGGGIPVKRNASGAMEGVEAVIDKDRTAALLAQSLDADALLLLTDVSAVFRHWGTAQQCEITSTTPTEMDRLSFAPGSMGPKVAAAADFVRTSEKLAGIGQLSDARAILEGQAGTRLVADSAQ